MDGDGTGHHRHAASLPDLRISQAWPGWHNSITATGAFLNSSAVSGGILEVLDFRDLPPEPFRVGRNGLNGGGEVVGTAPFNQNGSLQEHDDNSQGDSGSDEGFVQPPGKVAAQGGAPKDRNG